MESQPLFWIAQQPAGSMNVGILSDRIVGDLRQISIYSANETEVTGQVTTLDNIHSFWTIGTYDSSFYLSVPYFVFLRGPSDDPCADLADCMARYPVYQKLYASSVTTHCDYTFQNVAGSLDSYPTPLSSDCYQLVPSSPTPSDLSLRGEIGSLIFGNAIIILILCTMLAGFVWNAIKTKTL